MPLLRQPANLSIPAQHFMEEVMSHEVDRRNYCRECNLKPTQVVIKDRIFQLNDISNEGVGVLLNGEDTAFHLGERIETICLPLKSGEVTLSGVVTHMSRTESATVCGIRFLFKNSDEFDAVSRFMEDIMAENA